MQRGQITVHAASVETQAPSTSQAEQQEPAAQREPEYYEVSCIGAGAVHGRLPDIC